MSAKIRSVSTGYRRYRTKVLCLLDCLCCSQRLAFHQSQQCDQMLPLARPVLPRASSGTSGFFFCGMMEEPVQKRSAISIKPTRGLIQIINSSDIREICVITREAAAQNSIAKSRSDTASSELWQTSSKPKVAATRWRSIGKVVPPRLLRRVAND